MKDICFDLSLAIESHLISYLFDSKEIKTMIDKTRVIVSTCIT